MTQKLGKWPWEQEQESESDAKLAAADPAPAPAPTELPSTIIPFPIPGTEFNPNDHIPFAVIQDDAIHSIMSFLELQGPDRGPFKLARDGEANQQLPGTSLPPWMMQLLNYLCGHPMLPYNHDRPTMVRDLLFMGASGLVMTLQHYLDDPELKGMQHIISHEATLRRYLHEEEMMQNHFIEDLSIAARALEMRMDAGQREATYQHLKQLFDFIRNIRDKSFWQPVFLKYVIKVPEILHAIQYIGEDDKYAHEPEYRAWIDMIRDAEEQRRDWDKEYE